MFIELHGTTFIFKVLVQARVKVGPLLSLNKLTKSCMHNGLWGCMEVVTRSHFYAVYKGFQENKAIISYCSFAYEKHRIITQCKFCPTFAERE